MTRSDTATDIDPGPRTNAAATTVSVLGTGMLGTALARALLRDGHRVTVWNRTAEKTDTLVAEGANTSATPADAVTASQILLVAVSTYDDVQAVLTRDAGTLAGRTLVNLSSGTPEQARALAGWAAEAGARYLDGAAMSGTRLVGQPDALFLYSGDPDAFAASQSMLSSLGRATYLGADPGTASLYDTALLAMNMGVVSGFHQAMALVGAAGVDAPSFAAVATDYLPFVTGLLPDHARQVHERRFTDDDGTLDVYLAAVEHLVDTGRHHGVDVEVPTAIATLLDRGVTAGYGRDGLARLADVIAGR